MAQLDSRIPKGELAGKWQRHKADIRLVNPSNKRKYEVIVVGAGLAGASASASLSDAAAEAPARPAPTTITSYLRLFEGFTRRMSALCRRHFPARSPWGILGSSWAMVRRFYRRIPRSTLPGIARLPMK